MPSRAQRHAHREVLLPPDCPDEQQGGNIRASNQQHHRRGRAGSPQYRRRPLHVLGMRRRDDRGPAWRNVPRTAAHERADPFRGTLRCHAPMQPGEVGIGRSAQRRQDVGVGIDVPEVRGQDADHGEPLRLLRPVAHIRAYRAADDRRIAAEAADPGWWLISATCGPPAARPRARTCDPARAGCRAPA